MKQIFHARKKRQLRFLVKKLKRLIKNVNQTNQSNIDYLVTEIRNRTKELSPFVATNSLRKIIGGVALFVGISFTQQAAAQTFADPVLNPFGLTTPIDSYYNLPSFADMDNDGDQDIIMSNIGYSMDYYENIGSVDAPEFAPPISSAFGVELALGDGEVYVTGDLDGDGDFDLIAGTYDGGLFFLENIGDASDPMFATAVSDPFGIEFTADYLGFPNLVDIDDDGDLDLFIGSGESNLVFIENIGTETNPQFGAAEINPFGISGIEYYFIPSFGDIDNDGDTDILIEDYENDNWVLRFYENIGSVTSPEFSDPVTPAFGIVPPSGYIFLLDLVDLDGDGDLDILGGEEYGVLTYFENTTINVSTKDLEGQANIQLSPNPVQDILSIQTDTDFERIEIFDATGKLMKKYAGTEKNIQLEAFHNGMYLLRFTDQDGNSLTKKIIKSKIVY